MSKILVILRENPNVNDIRATRVITHYRSFDMELGNPWTFGREWHEIRLYGRPYVVTYLRPWGRAEVVLSISQRDRDLILRDAKEEGHRWTRRVEFKLPFLVG
jgi:hypothetical protein